MIFDKLCEIDLEIDDDSEFDVEYEPIAEFEYEYEHEYEQQKKNEYEHEQQKKNEYEHEYEQQKKNEYEHEYEHEHEHERVDELLRTLEVVAEREERTRRAPAGRETGTSFTVLGEIRSRFATEGSTPENAGEAGGSFLVRSESRQTLLAPEREENKTPENAGEAGGSFLVRSESRGAPQVAGREMKNPRAARPHALRSTGSDDPTGGDDV